MVAKRSRARASAAPQTTLDTPIPAAVLVAFDPSSPALAAILADVAKRRYITVGVAGFLLLLPLAITSTTRWIASSTTCSPPHTPAINSPLPTTRP